MRELECNRALLLTMALISGADVSMRVHSSYRRTVLVFTVAQISKNIINCNKLS